MLLRAFFHAFSRCMKGPGKHIPARHDNAAFFCRTRKAPRALFPARLRGIWSLFSVPCGISPLPTGKER